MTLFGLNFFSYSSDPVPVFRYLLLSRATRLFKNSRQIPVLACRIWAQVEIWSEAELGPRKIRFRACRSKKPRTKEICSRAAFKLWELRSRGYAEKYRCLGVHLENWTTVGVELEPRLCREVRVFRSPGEVNHPRNWVWAESRGIPVGAVRHSTGS
jgi:hypothetical protein